MVHKIESEADFETQLNHDHLVVVDFFATWCGPCQHIAPLYEQLASKYPEVKFFKVDVDDQSDLAEKYEVNSMPTFKLFKRKQVVAVIEGADIQGLEKLIQKNA